MIWLHLDAVGGIAGDMFIAALLDAFPEHEHRVLAEGMAVLPRGVGTLRLKPGQSNGIHAQRFSMEPGEKAAQPSGHYADMMRLLDAAPIAADTRDNAQAILTIIAKAESAIHHVPLDHVHFHEIADWDSLVDVVCAGRLIAALGEAQWTVSDLPRGGGLVQTAHGLLPVPAPATAEILRDFTWRDDGIPGERVTPTGAAILRHLGTSRTPLPPARLTATGTGAGTRDLPGMPNILRVMAFETATQPDTGRVTVIEFDIDDMTGEEIAVAAGHLRAAQGVLDLTIGTRMGKKGRTVSDFRLMTRPEDADTIAQLCFSETSTLGLRTRNEDRRTLAREAAITQGIAIKRAIRPQGITAKAESDALAAIPTLAQRRKAQRSAEDV